jgi:OOP family OmpA-OmpF porin
MTVEIAIVVGHTDSVGTDTYNLKLGMRRAEAVKKYLVSRGVEAGRIYTDTKGEREPVATNKTAEGRSENRRVVVEVYGVPKYWNQ